MNASIVRLPAEVDEAQLGGKGANLQRLLALGLPVPEAVVVPVEASRAHLARPAIAALVAQGVTGEALRAAIIAEPLSEELAEVLQIEANRIGGALAVRSSAVGEDGGSHSFAGQHDTLLDVTAAQVADAVKRCWASLWSERAVEYRTRNGIGHERAAMAVVVQRLVRAEAAGVLFTCDPVQKRADRVIVEAVRGLGEALVSGHATPDRWVLARPGLEVQERSRAGASAVLDDAAVRELARTAIALEKRLGGAQDIEWARAGGRTWLLQTRPVTTLARGPLQVWSNTNAGELLPDVATPMTFDLVERFLDVLIRPVLRIAGVDLGSAVFLGRVAGRIYFSMNSFVALFRAMPGLGRRNPAEFFGGDQAALGEALARLRPEELPYVRAGLLSIAVGMLRIARAFWRHRHVDGSALLAHVRAQTAALDRVDLKALSDEELRARLDDSLRSIDGGHDAILCCGVGMACSNAMGAMARRWLGDADGSLAARLLSGMGGLDSAEAGLDLWRLADAARPVAALVLGEEPWSSLRPRLERSAEGRAFCAAFQDFLRRHGHHARGELDVATPRWSEEPDAVLATVRAFLQRPEATSPVERHRRRTGERLALEAECDRKLGFLTRRLFRAFRVRAQRGFTLRENIKSEAVRVLAHSRAILREAGRRLAERGRLPDADAVFFLHLEELRAELAGRSQEGLHARIAQRRAEHARHQQVTPPSVVVGDFDPAQARALPPAPASATRLRGIAVSPGVVEGTARVILRANVHERVQPGEILVAPFTDPGWTPYFVAASAVVVDLGGMLSHGSIVAREYGIPAVVNVGCATRVVKTGQRLRVDGHTGEVVILDPG